MQKLYLSPQPLQHVWEDGKLTVIASPEWTIDIGKKWKSISKSTYHFVHSSDEKSSKVKRIIKILSGDEYYVEVEVGGRCVREYFAKQK